MWGAKVDNATCCEHCTGHWPRGGLRAALQLIDHGVAATAPGCEAKRERAAMSVCGRCGDAAPFLSRNQVQVQVPFGAHIAGVAPGT